MSQELVTLGIFVIAFLYASVGHAGASGYIAVMALANLAPATIKPAALTLNIFVALQGSAQFMAAGHFSWRLFWPFALVSVPAAYLGGYINLPGKLFLHLVGIVLLASALRFWLQPKEKTAIRPPHAMAALVAGGMLGLLAGLTGTGGGIFLTPLLIIAGWAGTKAAAATSVAFIFVNSIAGLTGYVVATGDYPGLIWPWVIAALIGGSLGAYAGSRRFSPKTIQRCLAAVLILAGLKLLLT